MPRRQGRRLFAPEVVQTSAMDCGPAALKSMLEGHGIPVSYGRLREACQTDVDGTSIDTLEGVAAQLGLDAEQVMLPMDHLFLDAAPTLPALMVVRRGDGATHFVVAWRRVGSWLQLMDPAIGRRWVRQSDFLGELFLHRMGVAAAQWRAWAVSPDGMVPLRARIAALGVRDDAVDAMVRTAVADPGWFPLAALDASVRMIGAVQRAGGVARGDAAGSLLAALFAQTCDSTDDIFTVIPPAYWSVEPDPATLDRRFPQLILHGAVLLKVRGLRSIDADARGADADTPEDDSRHEGVRHDEVPDDEVHHDGGRRRAADASGRKHALSAELAAALHEKPARPLGALWSMLVHDGLTAPLVLAGAMVIAAAAIVLETLLFKGMFDLAWALELPLQRLGAAAALIAFIGVIVLIEVPIAIECLRLGRHLETRLRMAMLRKLPRLTDRYFQSRPVSDMAERSHSIPMVRQVPALGLQLVHSSCELVFTLCGIALIDPRSLPLAAVLVGVAIALPLALQPLINERDLRVRNHAGALHGFHLDALLGLVPIRAHRAQPAVRRQHEALLVEWSRASRSLVRLSVATAGAQAFVCIALAGALLFEHFLRAGAISGGDLLLVYWTLKLPAAGNRLVGLAHQYPAQRNVLLRLLEPLSAPEEDRRPGPAQGAEAGNGDKAPPDPGGVSIAIASGRVVAAGHVLLQDIDLQVAAGEQVAIVGRSGAGKSTLVGVLLGWHRLAEGHVAIDGQPLAGATLDALRRETAWVDPGVQLWNRPFVDNLGYACADDGLARIGAAIEGAGLRGVVRKLPAGLQTALGEGGALLSGGEGQRVRLGRALLQPAVRLVLLDEPFRGMDRHQRATLMDEARRHWAGATLLCVTHDVGETLGFDRVLVVEDGRVVEDGPPGDLAASPSRYRALLRAETDVHARLWADPGWRRLRIEHGRIHEEGIHDGRREAAT